MENVSDETVLGFVVSNIFGNFHRDPYLGTFIDEYCFLFFKWVGSTTELVNCTLSIPPWTLMGLAPQVLLQLCHLPQALKLLMDIHHLHRVNMLPRLPTPSQNAQRLNISQVVVRYFEQNVLARNHIQA